MVLSEGCILALGRSVLIAAITVIVAVGLHGSLQRLSDRVKRLAWILVLIPFFTPAFLVAYAYANFSLSLIHHPTLKQSLYMLLCVQRLLAPALAVITYMNRPTLSHEAMHTYRLLVPFIHSRLTLPMWWFRGPLKAWMVTFAFTFMFAFIEFEMASLFAIKTWTVSIFDAQVGGLPIWDSLRLTTIPALIQLAIILPALASLIHRAPRHTPPHEPSRIALHPPIVWSMLIANVVMATGIPTVIVFGQAEWDGVVIQEQLPLVGEVMVSATFALVAALAVYEITHRLAEHARRRRTAAGLALTVLAFTTGLTGPLVVSLSLLQFFQLPPARFLYDTPLPLILGLSAVLMPYGVILHLVAATLRDRESNHAIRLLDASQNRYVCRRASELQWRYHGRSRFRIAYLLWYIGYFDLTVSSILAPVSWTPAFVRLYNLSHYGQSAILSLMVALATIFPIIMFIAWQFIAKMIFRGTYHRRVTRESRPIQPPTQP